MCQSCVEASGLRHDTIAQALGENGEPAGWINAGDVVIARVFERRGRGAVNDGERIVELPDTFKPGDRVAVFPIRAVGSET